MNEVRLDPIKYEIFFNKLDQALNEARDVIRYLSGSVIVREAGESLSGFYLPTGEAVDVACGILMHFMNITRCIRYMNSNRYEAEGIGIYEGDQFMNNDAYLGGMHVPDTGIVAPFYYKGELLGYTAGISHTTEVGGIEPGGMCPSATEAFHDGLIVPVVKLVERGQMRRDVFNMILRGTRDPRTTELDIRARVAGNARAHQRLTQLVDEFGVDFFKAATRQLVDDGGEFFRAKLRRMKPGKYVSRVYEDTLGGGREKLAAIQVELEITADGQMILRAPVVSPQQPCYNNAYLPAVEATLFYILLTQMVFDGRWNSGMEEYIKMEIPEHSRINADPDQSVGFATVGICFSVCAAITEALSRAYYASGMEEEVQAAAFSSFMGPVPFGIDQFGRIYGNILLSTGLIPGGGGCLEKDGIANYHFYNPFQYLPDVEGEEMITPTLNLSACRLPDSGGYGKYRGASQGGNVSMLHKTPWSSFQTMGAHGRLPGNQGLFGGYPGGRSYVNVVKDSNIYDLLQQGEDLPTELDDIKDITRKVQGEFKSWGSCVPAIPTGSGFVWTLLSGSSGGLGDPIERDSQLIIQDIKDGVATVEHSSKVYSVAIDPKTLAVDAAKTRELREAKRKERLSQGIPVGEYIRQLVAKRKNRELSGPARDLIDELLNFSPAFKEEVAREEELARKDWQPLREARIKEVLFKLTPYVNIAATEDGRKVAVCSQCGFVYGDASEDYKLYALVYERDPAEILPDYLAPDQEWCTYREFYCPGCGSQIEVDQCPPGMPVIPNAQVEL